MLHAIVLLFPNHLLIMLNFTTAKNNFESKFDTFKLIHFLCALDYNDMRYGDYTGFGCEFLLLGINPNFYDAGDIWSVAEFIEDDYERLSNNPNINSHYIPLHRNWDTFLFYTRSDSRGLIFDFSRLDDKNKIIAYDGLTLPFTHNVVREFTPEEFLNEYGKSKFFSVSHWRVEWPNLGFSWNN